MANDENNSPYIDLRPVIARLKEIERKCESMGTRNEEFPMMKDRLASIISRLEAGEEPNGEPLAYRAIARELFPVAHLFESVGFMSVGKEIAHVERALQGLEPEAATPVAGAASPTPSSTSSAAAPPSRQESGAREPDSEYTEESDGEGIPRPILAGLFVLLAAVVVAAALIFEVGPFHPKTEPTPVPPSPAAVPTSTPQPPPTPEPRHPEASPGPRQRFADALTQARLSFHHGNLEEAVSYLSIAALIDRNHTSVSDVAAMVVDQLLRDARAAAAESRWQEADQILARARSVAKQFELDTDRIDATEYRFSEMKRYRIVEPDDREGIRDAFGKRVEVKLETGSLVVGRITDFNGSELVMDVEDEVGGGMVSFTDQIPLANVAWIRVWED